jgi:KUP system potassium uptake protein
MSSKKGIAALALGAIGVVFGDVGTSPLYAFQAVFGRHGQHLATTTDNIHGILSLIIWSITLVVSIKYIAFIMRADNQGEGGIMALVGLIKGSTLARRYKWIFIVIGLLGMSLFYGDSAITPAISVLSAVEGLKVVSPSLSSYVVPLTLVILAGLFSLQRYGTTFIGRLFGPVMLLWFAVIALGGGAQVVSHPGVLISLSPLTAVNFIGHHPLIAFVAMGAVVLTITGAEALYADMGHFGRPPIRRAWFFVVFPALLLCYLGQGALLLHNPEARQNPFILLFPAGARLAVVILAAVATLIASQSVISGAFSLTRQAIRLDFLPKMTIRHTSRREVGQVYVPLVNVVLFIAVVALVVSFGSAEKLANAYGIAVSGTLAADTILFLVVLRKLRHNSKIIVALATLVFLTIDIVFITANSAKIFHGGWFPLAIATIAFLIITTWLKGQAIVNKERRIAEGSLEDFVRRIDHEKPSRSPGQAVYIGHHSKYVPLALRVAYESSHELPENVTIVSVTIKSVAHVPESDRAIFDSLKYADGISHLQLYYGFYDHVDIPKTLQSLRGLSPELDFDPGKASYFVSLTRVVRTNRHNMARWRKSLYIFMSRNAFSTTEDYKLPIKHTEEVQSLILL